MNSDIDLINADQEHFAPQLFMDSLDHNSTNFRMIFREPNHPDIGKRL